MTTTMTPLEEWRAACPLHKWVKANGGKGAMLRLATKLGVARASLYNWMNGLQPRVQHLRALEAETKIAVSSWMRWLMAKPEESTENEQS